MVNKIKLSIILPCYNVARYISKCLDSLYSQDVSTNEYEIIAINDCSSDNTEQIIFDYQKKYKNLILINHKVNLKAGGARNTGLKTAKGTYIWFIDPDDYIEHNIFCKLLSTADYYKLDILSFNYYKMNDGIIIKNEELRFKSNIVTDGKNFFSFIINKWWQNGYPWRRIYLRSYLLESNFLYRERVNHEDQVFSLTTVYFSRRIIHLENYYYYYRFNTNSTTNTPPTYLEYHSMCLFASDLLNFSKCISSDISTCQHLKEVAIYNINLVLRPLFSMNSIQQKEITSVLFFHKKEIIKQNYFRGWKKIFFLNIAFTSLILSVFNLCNYLGGPLEITAENVG